MLKPPTAYQGGKQRLSGQIIDTIKPDETVMFYDVCCGSGAISIELVNRGFPPKLITMIDAGPWGLVWEAVGNGTFDLGRFKKLIDEVPTDPSDIQKHIETLSKQPACFDTPYVFLLLQASSFGSKAIWIEKNRWMNCSFRNYWLPTATSSRRSPVNPMMPMPNTLFFRMEELCAELRGVIGICSTVDERMFHKYYIGAPTIYVDPPYTGTTAYGHDLINLENIINSSYWISEGKALSDEAVQLSAHRTKGGISGDRKSTNEEWLSFIRK